VHVAGVDAMPYLWCGGTLTAVDTRHLGATSPEIPAEGLFAELDPDDLGTTR
jgi:hypothetical protein